MKFKILLIAIVFLGIGSAFLIGQSEAAVPQLDENLESAVLASTVQIAMYEFATEPGGTEQGGEGLGTVINYGGQRLLVTHDHWSHLNENLKEVEFRNWAGQLLLALDATGFQSLIVYRDGGTMVLRVPDALSAISEAEVAEPASDGDIVWVAKRDLATNRRTVTVVPTSVTAVDVTALPAKMRLENLDGSGMLPGDSGGGVWLNGKLVANNWASGVAENNKLLSIITGGDEQEATSLLIVALQPFGTQIGVTTTDSANNDDDSQPETMTKDNVLAGTLLVD